MKDLLNKDAVDPDSVNIDISRLNKVVRLFEIQQQKGAFPGGQLVVRRNGKLVHSHAIGIARGFRPSERVPPMQVKAQTPFPVLSAGKPLAAIAIALLEDRGILDVEAPIAQVVPEFSGQGKERITLLDVLTHRSGMLMPEFVKNTHLWGNREEIQKALIECKPSYPRGTLAYHPHEYGWILNEVVLAVDGRSLPVFFEEEIATPLQLPALRFGLAGRDVNTIAFSYWLGSREAIVAGSNVAKDFEWQNSEEFFSANNPATSLVTNADSIAALYDFLLLGGKAPSGKQLISGKLLHEYTAQCVFGWDRSLRTALALGRGFVVGTLIPSSFGWWNTGKCFGHAGGFSSLAFADYDTNISVAIVTNGNRSLSDFARRFIPIAHGLRRACRN